MFSFTTATRIALLTFLLLVAACGQTGPLFAPEEPAPEPDIAAVTAVPPQDPNAP